MDITHVLFDISSFLDRGGLVLYVIAVAAFVLWFLLFERLLFIQFRADREIKLLSGIWAKNRTSLDSQAIRQSLKSAFKQKLLLTLPLIQTLVRVTPLLGLFGTVYGMIEIFDVIARQGTGNARAMANGISMATLPTMAGMSVAIVGLFFLRMVESFANRKLASFNEHMA